MIRDGDRAVGREVDDFNASFSNVAENQTVMVMCHR